MALCGALACLIFSYPISIWAFEVIVLPFTSHVYQSVYFLRY